MVFINDWRVLKVGGPVLSEVLNELAVGKNGAVKARDPNLDFLRALAILMVLVHHVVLLSPPHFSRLHFFTRFGATGVDLFFVLSGWLIGGLYWREMLKWGDVEKWRFIMRRAIRTMPPYFGALFLYFCASWFAGKEFGGWRYFLFLQNYLERMPFFLISWSLCIEEHFYLLLPFLLFTVSLLTRRFEILIVAVLLPTWFRSQFEWPLPEGFGYCVTATHLRFEGLLFGVWASYLYRCRNQLWVSYSHWLVFAGGFSVIADVLLRVASLQLHYCFGSLLMAIFYGGLLVLCVNSSAFSIARRPLVYYTAIWSYSIYLTHSLVLQTVFAFGQRSSIAVQWGVGLVLVFFAGGVFHYMVESPSLNLRDRFIPKRE